VPVAGTRFGPARKNQPVVFDREFELIVIDIQRRSSVRHEPIAMRAYDLLQ
jgi:hypothetical protein